MQDATPSTPMTTPPPYFAAAPGADIEAPSHVDRLLHAAIGRVTAGISPVALSLAFSDWARHLALSPAKWVRLAEKTGRKTLRFQRYAGQALLEPGTAACIAPLPQDHRFDAPAWRQWPFNYVSQAFLLQQQWWHNATTGVGGVSPHHEQVVAFVARQLLDVASPANFIATNPEVLQATVREGGRNLWRGWFNLLEDWERHSSGQPPPGAERFVPGREVALTPGRVVYQNRLMELIQYAPAGAEVYAAPLLIVPAWIMKYYILDLSPHNSLVAYLVARGHTVFMLSWHNPGSLDGDLDLADYLRLGVLEALDAVRAIVPGQAVHAVGYCLGGTLLAIAAAHLARSGGDQRLRSLTLLAAQTDFTEAGELSLFIDESQLDFLKDIMWSRGYLDTRQMAATFQLLRSRDLIWSRLAQEYLLGRRPPMTDLMAWNADATRMPYRMHSEYLLKLFLRNDLAEGRYQVDDKPVSLGDIRVPLFAVATEADHVAPWRSVYKIHQLVASDIEFVLTSGGHNAGIVSEPDHPNRRYRLARHRPGSRYVPPELWYQATPASA
ncbi:PHA/PHB synthase family protein [Duganella callida]|uniref:Alpha/beta fold hydrolase n=1 Tax=Duganella callida TaxID=2561932 RepID=A0A4Y9SH30_9BURK|nr:alpha/beta fold hydrolase [Duganella callida]TFW23133.1 alpha/beta fold hydrolase [Duganella callida]